MTHRERFYNVLSGGPVDRAPFIDYMGVCNYQSCLPRWKREGLEQDATWETIRAKVGFDYVRGFYIYSKLLFWPEFNEQFVRRDGDKTYYLNRWGGLELRQDGAEVMPLTLEGPVRDRHTWDMVKERLTGQIEGRLPKDMAEMGKRAADSGLPVYAGDLPAGFFGALREILGFENFIYMFYDDPDLLEDILDTVCELWIGVYREIQRHVTLDYLFIWEDMCSKNGPLIGPGLFRDFLLPRYKRLIDAVASGGCKLFAVDSDGDCRVLVPLWMEGGVNVVMPWETQFGLDMMAAREAYPTLGMIGGLDKHVLEFPRSMMDAELAKVPGLLEKGRYIPGLDHGVTNDVPWDGYLYFFDKLREIIYRQ